MSADPFQLVIFDCDSTLSAIEGVDELASLHGVGDEVRRLTADAMQGLLRLEDVYGRRLDLIRPNAQSLQWLGRRYVDEQVAGAADTVRILLRLGKDIHIVSGGLRQAVLPLAQALGIGTDKVHAVAVELDSAGEYRGFDRQSPLARSGGKSDICARLASRGERIVAIGDGITDAEMRAAGATFIAFGGVVERPAVREQADRFVSGPSLLEILPHVLQVHERQSAGIA